MGQAPMFGMPAVWALDAWFNAQLQSIDTAAARLRAAEDTEALHDLRVGLRRLHSVLRAYNAWVGLKPGRLRRVRLLARASNAARDCEVQRAWLAGVSVSQPRERIAKRWLAEHFAALESAQVDARLASRWQKLAVSLRKRWHERLPHLPLGLSFGTLAAQALRDQARALLDRLQAEQRTPDGAGLHAVRVEAKRLRYLLEPLGHDLPQAMALIQMLKGLQEQVGELHDLEILLAALEQATGQAGKVQAQRCYRHALTGATPEEVRWLRRQDPLPGLCALGLRAQARYRACLAEIVQCYLEPAWGAALDRDNSALCDALTLLSAAPAPLPEALSP